MKRIQMKRTKGWRKPENTVYVGRPSKWGNPFKVNKDLDAKCSSYRQGIIDQYELWLRKRLEWDIHFLDELKGKDLGCWCPFDKPCHVDVIIKVLNEMGEGGGGEKQT